MKNIVYLHGKFLPLEDAHVSVLDRGFLFGDGVYEVIPTYLGKFFRLTQHLRRLKHSLDATKIPMPDLDFEALLYECLAHNHAPNDAAYLQITRGVEHARVLLPSKNLTPTVFIACVSPLFHSIEESRHGVHAITTPDFRWHNCHIKAITLLPNVLARLSAVNHHTGEAIMIREGLVTEGTASNVFIVQNNILITPPKGANILGGVTRDLVVELADKNNIPCKETTITREELETADEIWLTSSTRGIAPVVTLNECPVGAGCAGPLWEKMFAIYDTYTQEVHA